MKVEKRSVLKHIKDDKGNIHMKKENCRKLLEGKDNHNEKIAKRNKKKRK